MPLATPDITQSYDPACSHALVSDDLPELATTPEWREKMIKERKGRGLTQKALGELVGTSQAAISQIENGEQGSSKFILPICRMLEIEPPQHFGADDLRAWMDHGRKLHAINPRRFAEFLRLVEGMTEDEVVPPPAPPPKPSRTRTKR
jgi:transcriptional regulator with XRE-family HTH domain